MNEATFRGLVPYVDARTLEFLESFGLARDQVTASDFQELLGQAETDTIRAEGKAAHADWVESLNQLGPQASVLVNKQPKRYKKLKSKAKRVPIQELLAAARTHCADLPPDQSQCLMLSAAPSHVQQPTAEAACGGPRISRSPQSLLGRRPCSPNQHKVEEWLAAAPQQVVHPRVVQPVVKYRDLFLDELPDGLPPPRAFDMTIATVPNATVPKCGSPRFTQPELSAIRNVLKDLSPEKVDSKQPFTLCSASDACS
ncbi:hypothetical protein Esti_003250 [Eimeria stiedai]